jgi:hypothetical protein
MNDLEQAIHAIENLVSSSAKDSLLRSAVIVIKQAIDANTPWQSVKEQTSHMILSGTEARIDNGHHAAVFLNDGTDAHDIVATNAKALRFVMNGQVMFRKRVHHLGTKATKFWDNGADAGVRDVERLLESLGDHLMIEVR